MVTSIKTHQSVKYIILMIPVMKVYALQPPTDASASLGSFLGHKMYC